MTGTLFEKWFATKLLPALRNPKYKNWVVVIDNVPYHSVVEETTKGSLKGDIIDFMKIKGLPIPDPIPIKEIVLDIILNQT